MRPPFGLSRNASEAYHQASTAFAGAVRTAWVGRPGTARPDARTTSGPAPLGVLTPAVGAAWAIGLTFFMGGLVAVLMPEPPATPLAGVDAGQARGAVLAGAPSATPTSLITIEPTKSPRPTPVPEPSPSPAPTAVAPTPVPTPALVALAPAAPAPLIAPTRFLPPLVIATPRPIVTQPPPPPSATPVISAPSPTQNTAPATPDPTPEATPVPTPAPTPEPTPQPTLEPTPDPTPEATPEPLPTLELPTLEPIP